ncbi:MAG TPA: NUDIX hydrolase N-terminal domain-containing protein [Candidatus Binataceae bacterium]|nr:NUDIX hydrolase N-terminal domain-containing protein [Candidatus Binataceae bacterium]
MPDTQNDLLLELARFIERISALARTGLAFKNTGYDAERYEDFLREAARMRTLIEQGRSQHNDGGAGLFRRWRTEIGSGYDGYVTVGVGCGAIVFNERDELLMIQRPTGRWWYPTGFCDVGESPAQNTAREVAEETGFAVTPTRMIGILDSLKLGSPMRHIYSILFYCRLDGGSLRLHPLEALDGGFFPLDHLPEPLHGRDRRWISLAREFHFDARTTAYFDPL